MGVWAVVVLGVALALLVLLTSWRRGRRDADLGTVSHTWLAEQRFGRDRESLR